MLFVYIVLCLSIDATPTFLAANFMPFLVCLEGVRVGVPQHPIPPPTDILSTGHTKSQPTNFLCSWWRCKIEGCMGWWEHLLSQIAQEGLQLNCIFISAFTQRFVTTTNHIATFGTPRAVEGVSMQSLCLTSRHFSLPVKRPFPTNVVNFIERSFVPHTVYFRWKLGHFNNVE